MLGGLEQVLSRAPCMNFLSSLRQVNFQRVSHASVDHVRIRFSHASVDYLRMDTILRSLSQLRPVLMIAALLSFNYVKLQSLDRVLGGHIN